MITWIIYYADGSSFTSKDGPPDKAPRSGVQVVVNYSPNVGKIPMHGYDYFCWQGEWVAHDIGGLHDYLEDQKIDKHIVLRCYGIAFKDFSKIYEQAIHDKRMPWKIHEITPGPIAVDD